MLDFNLFSIKLGCSEYGRRVVFSILDKSLERDDINVFALYDSTQRIVYDDLAEAQVNQYYRIEYLDISKMSLTQLVERYHIDKIFFPCIQISVGLEGLSNLDCEVVFVSHDIAHEELYRDRIRLYMDYMKIVYRSISSSRWRLLYRTLKLVIGGNRYDSWREFIKPAIDLYHNNPKTRIITVSEYSKNSLVYYYSIRPEDITVLYSPQRCCQELDTVSDKRLSELIESGRKYYLMVSANRVEKNPYKLIKAFQSFSSSNPDSYLVTAGWYDYPLFANHIPLPFLSDSDLLKAYSNCYALLFPSFFEGFGYPSIEVMQYGKPVLASYSTAIPEILGDAAIYFCPFFESAIFDALNRLDSGNYAEYSSRSKQRYKEISNRQKKDLDTIVELLFDTAKFGHNVK